MKEPTIPARMLGHPIIAVPVTVGGLVFTVACLQTGGVIPAVLMLVALLVVGRASQQVQAYRAWKRAWDAMDDRPPRHAAGFWKKPLGVILAAMMVAYMVSQAHRPEYQLALGWMVLFGTGVTIALLWRRLRGGRHAPRHRGAKGDVVTVVGGRKPSGQTLDDAYAAMPDYCQQVMGGER